MSLDVMVNSLGISFVGGMAYGHWFDQKVGYLREHLSAMEKFDTSNKDLTHIKRLGSSLESTKYSLSALDGMLMGTISAQTEGEMIYGSILNGLAFYGGTVAGKSISKLMRHRVKLSDEQKNRIDTYISALKNRAVTDSSVEGWFAVERDALIKDLAATKNTSLLVDFATNYKHTIDYGRFVKLADELLGERKYMTDTMSLASQAFITEKGPEYGLVAYVMMGDKLVEASYKEGKRVKDTLGLRNSFMGSIPLVRGGVSADFKFIDWDGSREKVAEVVISKYDEQDVVLASIPKDSPLNPSLSMIYALYKSRLLSADYQKQKVKK